MYDLRERYGFCSGNDLHDFFREKFAGEPSPKGDQELNAKDAYKFVYGYALALKANNGGEWGEFDDLVSELKNVIGDFGDPKTKRWQEKQPNGEVLSGGTLVYPGEEGYDELEG